MVKLKIRCKPNIDQIFCRRNDKNLQTPYSSFPTTGEEEKTEIVEHSPKFRLRSHR